MTKGIIALDIDGTITSSSDILDERMKAFLERVVLQGWELIFLTGRTFPFAHVLLKDFQSPFTLVVQNGASLLEMPAKKILKSYHLEKELLNILAPVAPFVIEAGIAHNDLCFFCPQEFSEEMLSYFSTRAKFSRTQWQPLQSWQDYPFETFALAKRFLPTNEAAQTQASLSSLPFHINYTKDPFRPGTSILHFTHLLACKETALLTLRATKKGPLIVAGDDLNDLGMLRLADYSIVPQGAPQPLLATAHTIVPSKEDGMRAALQVAINLFA